MFILMDSEKAPSQKDRSLEMERICLNIIKTVYGKPILEQALYHTEEI